MSPARAAGSSSFRRKAWAAALLAACAAAGFELHRRGALRPSAAARGGAFKILVVGDSISKHPHNDAYPRQLQRLLDTRHGPGAFEVSVEAEGGRRSEMIAASIGEFLERRDPDLLVVMMGEPPRPEARLERPRRREGPGAAARAERPGPREGAGGETVQGMIDAAINSRHSEGKARLREIARRFPDNAQAQFALAIWLTELGRREEAMDLARRARTLRQTPESYVYQSEFYRQIGRWAQAVVAREKAYAAMPAPGQACRLAEAYLTVGRGARAIALLERAAREHPRDDKLAGALATAYLRAGRAPEASRWYEAAARIRRERPPDAQNEDFLRVREAALGRGIKILFVQYPGRELDTLVKLAGGEGEASFLGTRELFREAAARLGYEALFSDMDGGDFGHLTRIGHRLMAERLADEVARLARAPGAVAARSLPGVPAAVGAAFETRYRRLLREDPDDRSARYSLARLFEDAERFDEARAQYEALLEAEPEQPLALLGLARIDELEGRIKDAEQAYRRLLRQDGSRLLALKALARLYMGHERWGDASGILTQLREAATTHEDFVFAHRGLARLRERQGRFEEAAALYGAVLREAPQPQARLDYARACQAAGRRDKAEEQYRLVLAELPGHATARRALVELSRSPARPPAERRTGEGPRAFQ